MHLIAVFNLHVWFFWVWPIVSQLEISLFLGLVLSLYNFVLIGSMNHN
jgi:hypothetical protein